ncbi:hypothetical protein CERSUDRAFT_113445 [Gelatoporia subvermispora B]|uniref:Uncharacterized protein n=1 Tax=Ceriporiopsis subvermispora (strain B) TaxID=914234 RepID=M2RHI2_CERS8|nr:hypothetical protein CERSUDRAFT_113445 [Gelatoporia subvermispora B]
MGSTRSASDTRIPLGPKAWRDSLQRTASGSQSSPDKGYVAWSDRARLLYDIVSIQNDVEKFDKISQDYRQFQSSSVYIALPPTEKERITAALSKAAIRSEENRRQLHHAIQKLSEMDSWPPPPVSNRDGEELVGEDYAILREDVRQVKGVLIEMQKDLLQESHASASLEEDHQRRFAQQADDFNDLSIQLTSLEDRISYLNDALVEHDNDVLNEIEEQIRENIQHLPPSVPLSTYEQLQREMDTMGNQVTELADLMQSLLTSHKENEVDKRQTEEVAELRRDNLQIKQENAVAMQRIESLNAHILSLEQAAQEFASRPQELPPAMTADQIFKAVAPPLLQAVQADFAPLLQQVHIQIQALLDEHGNRIFSTIMKTVTDVAKTLDSLRRWAERHSRPSGSKSPQNAP